MTTPTRPQSLRRWLAAALLAIAALPPLVVWALHTASSTSTDPTPSTIAAARTFAIDSVDRWNDPAWQNTARTYFAAKQVDAELRPAHGPWFTTLAAGSQPARIDPADKFTVSGPGTQADLGSGWTIPHTTTYTSWTLPLTAGAGVLLLTVAATGTLLGRHVVRPLAAMSQTARNLAAQEGPTPLPTARVREVADVASALNTAASQLHAARTQRAELEDQRRLFIGAIAHDLRTPLFTLRSYLDGLHDGLATTPERTDRYLQVCRRSADTLDHLVTDLFTYARMEFLDQKPTFTQVDIAALLQGTVLAHQPRARTQSIQLTTEAPDGSCLLTGDEHLLTRVIDNLIDNALRHTPDGGCITVTCRHTGRQVLISVADTGAGIAPGDLPHLFEPLYRAESSRNRATGGAGLGLAIAQRVVHAHAGAITATNITEGACFTVALPVEPLGRQAGVVQEN